MKRSPSSPGISIAILSMVLASGWIGCSTGKQSQAPTFQQCPGWVILAPRVGERGKGHATVTRSAVPVLIGKHLKARLSSEQLEEVLGYDPSKATHTFFMEKNTFLLGEPMLVRFKAELDGEGACRVDDWLYHDGRDETFIVLMRDQDGKWVPNRFHAKDVYTAGGMFKPYSVTREKPDVRWFPVQEYCAITRSGKYELFCMKWHTRLRFHDHPHSPLIEHASEEAIARAKGGPVVDSSYVTDYAEFTIEVKLGSDEERRDMVRNWTGFFYSAGEEVWSSSNSKHRAVYDAWRRSLQDDFVPYLTAGLLPETAANQFLRFFISKEFDRWEHEILSRSQVGRLIPLVIDRLTAKSAFDRSLAQFHLRRWTKHPMPQDWQGHDSRRPTLQEGRELQRQWRRWWKQNKGAFESR